MSADSGQDNEPAGVGAEDVPAHGAARAVELAGHVAQIVAPSFDRLERVAALAADSRQARGRDEWRERDLTQVQELILRLLAEDQLAVGMGFVAAPDQINGEERYMLWWQQHQSRTSRLRLNFDRSSIDVYDYVEMEWFRRAGAEQPRVTFGPYVDYSGSELYIITASVAVIVDAELIGVAGADLLYGELERRLITVLRESSAEAFVLNSERRVVASNSAHWVPGSRLKVFPATGDELGDRTVTGVAEPPLGIGWLVVVTSAAVAS